MALLSKLKEEIPADTAYYSKVNGGGSGQDRCETISALGGCGNVHWGMTKLDLPYPTSCDDVGRN